MQLLSTKLPDQQFTEACEQAGIHLTTIPFIKTAPVVSYDIGKRIAGTAMEDAHIVFTSSNAVEAVSNYLQGLQPEWNIYCTSASTQKAVEQLLPSAAILAVAPNAEELARQLIASGNTRFLFFCGDQRRNELPDALKAAKISVEEIIVYKTIATPVAVAKEYDAIAFFSPSAVASFFSINEIPGSTVLFCIGKTTAAALDKNLANTVIIAEDPSQETMIRTIINHFRAQHPEAGKKVPKLK